MIDKLNKYMSDFEAVNDLDIDNKIEKAQNQLDFDVPTDYLEVIGKYDGSEGEVGEHRWLDLFPINQLIEINGYYSDLMDEIPDYFLFGKDAADTGFAFHKKNGGYYAFGLMSNFATDPIKFYGNTFLEFIKKLYNE